MRHFKEKYSSSFIYACVVHIVVIALLLISLSTAYKPKLSPPSGGDIVQAALLDPSDFAALPPTNATSEVTKNSKGLPSVTQRSPEENQLAQIQLAKEKEKKELEALRVKKAKEEKRLAALEDKRLEEQERANQMRLERQKEEKRKKDLLEAKKKTEKAEEDKKMAQARAAEEAQRAADNAKHQQWMTSERDKYKILVRDKIKGGWLRPEGLPPGLSCTIKIGASPDGSVHAVSIIKSSGNLAFDQTTLAAVHNATPLPFPPVGDPELTNNFLDFTLDFKDDGEVTEYAI